MTKDPRRIGMIKCPLVGSYSRAVACLQRSPRRAMMGLALIAPYDWVSSKMAGQRCFWSGA